MNQNGKSHQVLDENLTYQMNQMKKKHHKNTSSRRRQGVGERKIKKTGGILFVVQGAGSGSASTGTYHGSRWVMPVMPWECRFFFLNESWTKIIRQVEKVWCSFGPNILREIFGNIINIINIHVYKWSNRGRLSNSSSECKTPGD